MRLQESSGTPDSLQEPAAMETSLHLYQSVLLMVLLAPLDTCRDTPTGKVSVQTLLGIVKPWRAESVMIVMAEPHPLK